MSQLSLKDLASQATARLTPLLQQALAALPGFNRRLLVISLGDFAVQALVLTKGAAGPEVVRFAEVTFDTSVRNVRTRLARIMEALDDETAGQVLIVSPEVRFVAAEVPDPPKRRFSRSPALAEGARWEIAPFLDFPSERALIGLSLLPTGGAAHPDERPEAPAEEGPPRRPAWIFALDRQFYDTLKRACREHKKRLLGVLPEEAFGWALTGPDKEGAALLIDWHLYEVLGALTRDGKPVRVLREPIRGGEPDHRVLARVIDELLHDTSEVSEVIIGGGPQSEQADLGQLFDGHGGPLVRKWSSEQDLLFAAAAGPLPARYLGLLGAAAAWTAAGPKAGGALIDVSKPLPVLVREHVHALPLALLGLLALGLGGQYLHLKQKTYRLENQTIQLSEQKKSLGEAAAAESRLKSRYRDLKERKSELARKNELLAAGLQERHRQLLGLLQDLTTRIPGDIRLSRLSQFSDRIFFIEGTTLHYPAITECVVNLKESPQVEKCQLEKSTRQGEERQASYTFTIRLRLEERHG